MAQGRRVPRHDALRGRHPAHPAVRADVGQLRLGLRRARRQGGDGADGPRSPTARRCGGTGIIDPAHWSRSRPIEITSRHQLPRTRAIFYARDAFSLHGEGDFTGTVHKYNGGYEVKGDFVSAEAGYDDYRFQDFRAAIVWVPSRFDVLERRRRVLRRRGQLHLSACSARRAGPACRRRWDVSLPRRRPDHLHQFPRDARPAAGRPCHRPHHAGLDARPDGRGHRRRLDAAVMPAGYVPALRGSRRTHADGRAAPRRRAWPLQPAQSPWARCRSPARSTTPSTARRSASRRAASPRPRPTSPSTAAPPGARRRACPSTCRASTGRRATAS